MTDTEFIEQAEQLLRRVESACDLINDSSVVDIDNQRVGGLLTLTFAGGRQIVVNMQKPLHEIWLAAPSGAYHYRFDANQWSDTRQTGEFFAELGRLASQLAGHSLSF